VISNEDVSRAIKDCADRSLLEACVYMDGQNAIWSLTSPGEWTWEYNATTGQWNEGQSYGVNDRRIRHSVRAFDRWIVGDDATGLFAEIDPDYHFEYGDPLIWELRSGSNASFPYPVEIPAAFFNFVAALGSAPGSDPIETTPKVMISWSLDGGYRYGNELTRELGRQGEGSKLVRVNGLGTTRSKGIRFRLRISDPVDVVFFGGEMPDVKARAA
jgi:hypothetical protein